MRPLWLASLALMALCACAKGGGGTNSARPANAAPAPPANAVQAPAAPSAKLSQIFTPDILGANVAYLETLTGPAFSTEGSDRIYKVDGCKVIVGVAGPKIDNIGIEGFSARCSFPIAQYFAGGYDHPVPPYPTFGDIKTGLGGAYGADCLALCGNAANPVVALSYQGSHADNFNDLLAEISIADEPALTAYQDWSDKLAAKYGQDYVTSGKFNNGDNLDDVVSKDFAPIRPDTIRVGQDLPTPGADAGQ